jgi:hypothetical protein
MSTSIESKTNWITRLPIENRSKIERKVKAGSADPTDDEPSKMEQTKQTNDQAGIPAAAQIEYYIDGENSTIVEGLLPDGQEIRSRRFSLLVPVHIHSAILRFPGSNYYCFIASSANLDNLYVREDRFFVLMSIHPDKEGLDLVGYWKLPVMNSTKEECPKFHSLRITKLPPGGAHNYIISIQISKTTFEAVLLNIEPGSSSFNELTESISSAIKQSNYCILKTEQPIYECSMVH